MNTLPEFPPRRGSATQQPASGYPRRGQPVAQTSVDSDLPRRGKPVGEPTAPPRRLPPDRDDLPPCRPGSDGRPAADANDDLPPRRGQPVPKTDEDKTVNNPPTRRYPDSSAPAPVTPPSQVPAAPVDENKTDHAGSKSATLASNSDAAEMESILKMIEAKIPQLNLSAPDLHKLASLICSLGKRVSILAQAQDAAGTHPSTHDQGDEPEPED